MPDQSTIQKLTAALPSEVVFSVVFDAGNEATSSFFDVTIKDSPGTDNVLEGMTFDSYCIDTDRFITVDREPFDGLPEYTADVYSSYDLEALEAAGLTGGNIIEFPENLDIVNWIINQGFEGKELFDANGNSLGKVTSGDVQQAIWHFIDDTPTSGGPGIGAVDQDRIDRIIALAELDGDNFVPSFEYTTIFGEQVIGQMAVIFIPDSTGDGLPDNQIIIGEVELAKLGDRVWLDADADGIQDAGENGIAGVTVNLLADVDGDGVIEDGEIIDTTTTDANGNYEFEVIAGDYKVEFEQPEGLDSVSPRQQGDDPTNDSDGLISDVVTLNPGENDPTIDAGFYNTAGLGDFVFEDSNGNGIQDAGENGVAGVEVKLQNPDGSAVLDENGNPITTTTDVNGEYAFTGLIPGEYKVMFVAPEGFEFTEPNVGDDDTVDSDADPENGMTQTIVLESGDFNGTLDAGLIQRGGLGDFVFYDINQNGLQDAGEEGIAGVTVLLLDADGNQLDSTTTDESGAYSFNNLAPGQYKVQFTQPDGFEFVSPFLVGNNPEIDSDADPTNNLMSGVISLESGEFNNTIDAGFYRRTKPGIDIEKATNGEDADNPTGPEIPVGETATFTYEVTNTGDIALDNVEVIDDNGTPDDTSDDFAPTFVGGDTDGDGKLDVGEVWEYEATRTVTEGQYSNIGMVTGHAPNGTIVMDMDPSNHFGLKLAKIGDFVWHDLDGNGIQNEGEPGIAGATVILLDANGNLLQTTTTDGSGMYMFNDLNPLLTYTVTFDTPTGFDSVSPRQVGNDPTIDSDGLTSDPIVLSPGEFNDTIDAGFYQFGKIGDFVFNDLNRDGIQDPDEPGINGAIVQLLNANGNVIATTTTGDDPNTPGTQTGYYEFGGLTPGVEYTVRFLNPAGFEGVSPRQVGGDSTIDSDGLISDPIKLLSGQFNNTIDAGFFQLPASLGDFVWHDLDADGIQDAGEPGIAGAEVKLLDVNSNILDTTVTNSNGFYEFTDLDAGQYKVMFNTPTGFDQVSPRQVGNNPAIDSDGLMSDVVTLAPGDNNRTIDSGFYQFAKIGDFVFNDLNENGIQDPNEPGIDGAEVKLLDANGNVIATTTTGDDPNTPGTQQGYYEFGGVTPGQSYQVMFVNPDGFSGVSPFQAGNNPNIDSDANPDNNLTSNPIIPLSGQFVDSIDGGFFKVPDIVIEKFTNGEDADVPTGPEILVGDTAIFTYKVLNTGETPLVDVVVTDDNGTPNDPSDDFNPIFVNGDNNGNGIFDPGEQWVWTASRTVTPGQYTNIAKVTATNPNSGGMVMDDDPSNHFGVLLPGTIGDFVWNDLDQDGIQDPNEPGIAGATVKLLDGNGVFLDDTVTDANGFYQFTNLNPGDYRVMFVNPDGFDGVSPFLSGFDTTVDSDANPNNNLTSGLITLTNGETNNSIDAGFFRLPASLGDFVFEDLNANGIQDAGEQGIAGAEVKLLDVNGTVLDTTTTNSTGFYEFTDLDAGQYKVMFNTPDGFDAVSPRQVGNNPAIDSDGLMSDIVTLDPGENDPTIDAGFYKFAKIGDFVFNDVDRDGIQDDNEEGIEGAEVKLLDANGTVLKTTTTDETGFYHFNELTPGVTYKVMFNNPEGFDGVSPRQVGNNPAIDSDGLMSDPVVLSSGEFNTTIDAGFFQLIPDIEIEKYVRVDENPIALKKLVAVEPLDGGLLGQDLCNDDLGLGKPEALIFEYIPGSTVNTNQDADKAEIHVDNGIDSDGTSFVVVTDENEAAKALNGDGKQFFRGDVDFNELFEANNSTDSFGSTTYIHFFDDANGGLLQTIEYHTSCSQPIQLGDVIGNATLYGYDGENALLVTIPEPEFVDANEAPGPETLVGTDVAFRYEVTNTGTAEISNVELTDNRIADLTFVEGDTDGDGNLDTDETWIYSATETAGEGLITNIGTVTGLTATGQTTIATDVANYTGVDAPTGDIGTEGQAVCETEGKPEAMVFEYNPSVIFDTQQDSSKGEALINGTLLPGGSIDADGVSYIVVTEDDNFSDGIQGDVYFAGNVAEGERFTASIFNANTDKFQSNTFFYFFDSEGGELLQSARYHTSCSAPILLGDGILSATLVGYDGIDGNLISLPVPEEPVEPPTTSPAVELPQIDDPFDVNNIGETGDTAPGPVANVGDIVTFTYEVTNTGNVDLTINDLVDDNATPDDPTDDFTPEFVQGDDGDGIFNPGEVWYFQAKEVATRTGVNTNTIKVKATDDAGTMVMADDPANYIINPLDIEKLVAVEPINGGELGQDVCETEGKVDAILFEYNPGNTVNTAQDSGKAGIVGGSNAIDSDGVSFVIVTEEEDAAKVLKEVVQEGKTDKLFFAGDVAFGETFLADESTNDFGSNTYVHFFDDETGGLLQSINYHTSCSQPIRLGDVVGNATLVGYDGENGDLVTLPDPEFVDADNPTGPQTIVGTEVQFKYVVSNTGNVGLTDVQVTDDKIAGLELVENGNGDNILDAGEQWIYTASEIAKEGQQTNKATVIANIGETELMDMDHANYEGIITPPPQGDVCDTLGKPEAMTFTYNPGTDVLTGQDPSKAGILTQNGVDDDGTSFVIVTDEDKAMDALTGDGKQFFRGEVEFGESFQATNTTDSFGSNTFIHFFDDANGGLLQSINYHTSCSQPIAIGDVVGNATLSEYFGENGQYDNPMIDPVNTMV
ncbi:MAG: SdrD B-like domain-containing protein [Crocosphaera sp.]|nr:SdrD B-like domain-containing protein [Crocosphaera sp.]